MFSLSEIIKPSSKIKVIDVGASLLEAPLYMPLIESGLAALVAFEPDQAECQRLNDLWGGDRRISDHFFFDGRKKSSMKPIGLQPDLCTSPIHPFLSNTSIFQSLQHR